MATVSGQPAICLLRGVNVGGHGKMPMAELRDLFASLGLPGAQTYIQSGNVVFRTTSRNLAPLEGSIEAAIQDRFGFPSAVLLRTAAEWRQAVARNPFGARPGGVDPAKLAVTFLRQALPPRVRSQLLSLSPGPEEVHIRAREMYVYYPLGMGRTTLSLARMEKLLGTPSTTRNWNTVQKLLAMVDGAAIP